MIRAVVFDLGGTLMEYRGMPPSWTAYYRPALEKLRKRLNLPPNHEQLERAAEILAFLNPRVNYREEEYSPEFIFSQAVGHWKAAAPAAEIIAGFFEGMSLQAVIFRGAAEVLAKLKGQGLAVAALTDLPSGMPDALFREGIEDLIGCFDLYVSSQTCGFRKPNPAGLHLILRHFSLKPEEVLFVGDEEKDILTARRAGCRSAWIGKEGTPPGARPDYVVRSLWEVPELAAGI